MYHLGQHCAKLPFEKPIMLVNTLQHQRYTENTVTHLPTWGQWKVTGGINWHLHMYHNRSQLLPLLQILENSTCVGLSSAFLSVPFMLSSKQQFQDVLRPAQQRQQHIDE